MVQAISSSGIRLMYVSRVWIYKNKLDPSKDLGQISLVLSMVNLGHVQIRPTHVYIFYCICTSRAFKIQTKVVQQSYQKN